MSGSAGQAIIPIGAAIAGNMIAPGVGTALGSAIGSSVPAWVGSAASGALMGGLGSYMMGGNPLQGMMLGGIGGGIGSGLSGSGGLGELFGGGINPAEEAISPALAAADPSLAEAGAAAAAPSALEKFLPYAGLAGGAMLLDKASAPKQVGPGMRPEPKSPGTVSPLDREYTGVDPQSYLTTGGNKSFFAPYSMKPVYMAKGGYANGGSSQASSQNIPVMRRIRGQGDGMADKIPAALSDGEVVFSAPAVSAVGNGSNDAGAKKLMNIHKEILKKHYKGGKPHKSVGLGSYVH